MLCVRVVELNWSGEYQSATRHNEGRRSTCNEARTAAEEEKRCDGRASVGHDRSGRGDRGLRFKVAVVGSVSSKKRGAKTT